MKTNILFLRLFILVGLLAAGCQLSTSQVQDTLYTYQSGLVVSKQAVLEIDSMTFISPTNKCGAYIAPQVWKVFMCYNLGANTELDPFTYSDGVNGDLY